MAAIGSLVFCTDCGNLLNSSTGDTKSILRCDCCGAENRDTSSKTVVTESKPSAFPSLLRQKHSALQQVERSELNVSASIMETCEKCGEKEVSYISLQLRSADEGSTNFYTCQKCGNKWNTNN